MKTITNFQIIRILLFAFVLFTLLISSKEVLAKQCWNVVTENSSFTANDMPNELYGIIHGDFTTVKTHTLQSINALGCRNAYWSDYAKELLTCFFKISTQKGALTELGLKGNPYDAYTKIKFYTEFGKREVEIKQIKSISLCGQSNSKIDTAIEKLIDTATPEADEETRKVQRKAIKLLLDPRPGKSKEHLDNMMKNAKD